MDFINNELSFKIAELYESLSALPHYSEIKALLEELSSMKIDTKPLREALTRCKTRTELFGKSFEKLKREKNLRFFQEKDAVDWISAVLALRNDLISQEIVPSVSVQEFQAFEWTISAEIVAKGWISFLREDLFLAFSRKKPRKVANFAQFAEKMLQDAQAISAKTQLFAETEAKLRLNLQVFARVRGDFAEIELCRAKFRENREENAEKLRKDANFSRLLATQRRLLPKTAKILQILEDAAQTKLVFFEESAILAKIRRKAQALTAEIADFRDSCARFFEHLSRKRQEICGKFEELLRKTLVSPVFLEESEEFLWFLLELRGELRENLTILAESCTNVQDRAAFLRGFCGKLEKFPLKVVKLQLLQSCCGIYLQNPQNSQEIAEILQELEKKLENRGFAAVFADFCYFFLKNCGKTPLKLQVFCDFASLFARNLAKISEFLTKQAYFPDFSAKIAKIRAEARALLQKTEDFCVKTEPFSEKTVDFIDFRDASAQKTANFAENLERFEESCEKLAKLSHISAKMELEPGELQEKWQEYAVLMENAKKSLNSSPSAEKSAGFELK